MPCLHLTPAVMFADIPKYGRRTEFECSTCSVLHAADDLEAAGSSSSPAAPPRVIPGKVFSDPSQFAQGLLQTNDPAHYVPPPYHPLPRQQQQQRPLSSAPWTPPTGSSAGFTPGSVPIANYIRQVAQGLKGTNPSEQVRRSELTNGVPHEALQACP
jgi:hypothetical protein